MLNQVRASVVGGTHQRCTAVLVLYIDVRAGSQQQLRHFFITMGNSQYQCGLAVLWMWKESRESVFDGEKVL